MSTVATIWYKPTFRFSPIHNPKLMIIKPRVQFLRSKSIFYPGFAPMRTGVELIQSPALKSISDNQEEEERLGFLQQEALVNGVLVSQLESTINRLCKWIVSGLFAAVILWRHDAEALSVGSYGLCHKFYASVALKRIFNPERPLANLRSDPGMPKWMGVNDLSLAVGAFVLAFALYLLSVTIWLYRYAF